VYEWGPGSVLKLYRASFPREWVEHEARLGRLIRAAGHPAPAVGELVEEVGRVGYVCERAQGPSWLDELQCRPWRAVRTGHALARLHVAIHRRPAPGGLPELGERLAQEIRHPRAGLGPEADAAAVALKALPDGEALCHYDFHPGNVLGSGDRLRVIDWLTAARGAPAADVARTLLILDSPFLPPGFPALLRRAALGMKRRLGRAYLAEYCRLTGLSRAEVDAWRAPVAAARLWEQVPGEREWLLLQVRRELAVDSPR
jgi:aminoglycoside phosphotransferase (APT) family kinase protein